MNIFDNKNIAGWTSIASALVTIPVIVISMYSGYTEGINGEKNSIITTLDMTINSIYLLIFVIIFINFKNLLNSDLEITSLDLMITLVIGSNVLITSLSIISMPFQALNNIVGVISVIFLIPYGILHTVFGIKIMKLDNELFGWRKSFSIFTIFTGISTATVILIPLGLITSMVSDVLLALIFFSSIKKTNTLKE